MGETKSDAWAGRLRDILLGNTEKFFHACMGAAVGIVLVSLTHEQAHAITAELLGMRIVEYHPLSSVSLAWPVPDYVNWIVAAAPYLFSMFTGLGILKSTRTTFWETFSGIMIVQPWITIFLALISSVNPALFESGIGGADFNLIYLYPYRNIGTQLVATLSFLAICILTFAIWANELQRRRSLD